MSQDGSKEAAKLSQDGILGSEFEVWRDLGRFGVSLGGHFEDGLSWLMLELCWDIIGSRMAAKIVI